MGLSFHLVPALTTDKGQSWHIVSLSRTNDKTYPKSRQPVMREPDKPAPTSVRAASQSRLTNSEPDQDAAPTKIYTVHAPSPHPAGRATIYHHSSPTGVPRPICHHLPTSGVRSIQAPCFHTGRDDRVGTGVRYRVALVSRAIDGIIRSGSRVFVDWSRYRAG